MYNANAYRILERKPLTEPGQKCDIKIDIIIVRGDVERIICLRTATICELLLTRQWTFGFHKMRGISWLASTREGLCPVELGTCDATALATRRAPFNQGLLHYQRVGHKVGVTHIHTTLDTLSISWSSSSRCHFVASSLDMCHWHTYPVN